MIFLGKGFVIIWSWAYKGKSTNWTKRKMEKSPVKCKIIVGLTCFLNFPAITGLVPTEIGCFGSLFPTSGHGERLHP